VRRFNDQFLKQYGLNPLRFRKRVDVRDAEAMTFALGYRPPFCWSGMLAFFARRGVSGVEHVGGDTYARTIVLHHADRDVCGWISVRNAPQRYALDVTLSMSLTPVVGQVLARVRRLFDLSSHPELIDTHLGELAAGAPGMRVPGALDGFEIAVHAIAAQQIPAAEARQVLSRVAGRLGTKISAPFGLSAAFPSAAVFARLPLVALEQQGLARPHAEAIVTLAGEVSSGRMTLEPAAPLEETLAALRRIHGVGEWAVQYIAMRSLGWPNAFPDDDPLIRTQLDCPTTSALDLRAEPWQPWRAYATVHLWNQLEEQHS
ncbi:MAG TPA: AlkA N-terminal domain-containing protein, partial [Paraburkholderia sp.]